jgi:hypothetical protein
LVAAAAWLFVRWPAYWAVRYELRSVSARDARGGTDHLGDRTAPFREVVACGFSDHADRCAKRLFSRER